jgi:hypothetical protein
MIDPGRLFFSNTYANVDQYLKRSEQYLLKRLVNIFGIGEMILRNASAYPSFLSWNQDAMYSILTIKAFLKRVKMFCLGGQMHCRFLSKPMKTTDLPIAK